MLETRQLRYFIAVAEELHFAHAADRLHVAQSAVSQQIKALEESFGARLLDRGKRAAVSLTPAGQLFLTEAVAALRQLEKTERVGRLAARGELGWVELGYVVTAATNRTLPMLLRDFRRSHPAVRVGLRTLDPPQQLAAIAEGRLDAGLIRPPRSLPAGVSAQVFHREGLCVALAIDHPLARGGAVRPADLANEAFISPRYAEDPGIVGHLERVATVGGFAIETVHEVGEFVAALSMAAAGYGVVVGPQSLSGFNVPEVVFRPLADVDDTVELAVAFRTAEPSASVRAIVACAIALGRRRGGDASPPFRV
jgi:DNA-binding transcriptional LysR family regulator